MRTGEYGEATGYTHAVRNIPASMSGMKWKIRGCKNNCRISIANSIQSRLSMCFNNFTPFTQQTFLATRTPPVATARRRVRLTENENVSDCATARIPLEDHDTTGIAARIGLK